MAPSKKAPGHYFTPKPSSETDLRRQFLTLRGQSLIISTAAEMFSPDDVDEGTRILIDNLILPQKGPILDLGAGYGPISLWVAKEFQQAHLMNSESVEIPQIYAVEVNERAAWLLNKNANDNNCKNIQVFKGDFLTYAPQWEATGVQFTAIYTNPPLKLGHDIMLQIFENAFKLLHPSGFLQYVHKKTLGAEGFMQKLIKLRPDWNFEIVRKKAGYHVYLVSATEIPLE
jgi:16S rRNA (guanine1207-N2)-methyltransferase